jgi:hypothetical protein
VKYFPSLAQNDGRPIRGTCRSPENAVLYSLPYGSATLYFSTDATTKYVSNNEFACTTYTD